MTKKELQIFAGAIVVESKLSKPAKLQLLNWIQNEATEPQIKAMLLDGEAFIELDELAETMVNKRFSKSRVSELAGSFAGNTVLPSNVVGIAGAALAAFIISRAINAIRILSTAKECKDFRPGTPGHRKCEVNVKIRNEEMKIKAIQSKASLCSKSKDPAKCKASIQSRVEKIKNKITKLKHRI